MDRPLPADRFDELLAHRDWVRKVAFALLRDEGRADDLEQNLWLRALRSPPPRPTRAWLGTVLRNLASNLRRQERRRGIHEALATAGPQTASPAELLERAEVVEHVARAVRELEEPYRTAILLRYFEDLSPPDVATRLGAPIETVRTRLKRGLAMLRERLDSDHDGDRRAWFALLAPLGDTGGSSIRSPALTGGFLMTMKAKAGMAAAVILLLAGWLALQGDPEPARTPETDVAGILTTVPPRAPEPPPPSPPPPTVDGKLEPPPASQATPEPPSEAPSEAPPPAPVPPAVNSVMIRYTGRVIDDHRRPVAGAAVEALIEGSPVAVTSTDGEGRFEAHVPGDGGGERAWRSHELLFLARTEDGRVGSRTFIHRQVGEDMLRGLVLVVGPGRTLDVTVVDGDEPVPGAEVVLACGRCALLRGSTDPTGRASLGPLPLAEGLTSSLHGPILLAASAPGRGRGEVSFAWPPREEGPLLVRLSSRDIPVEVVDADTGKGIPAAFLWVMERVHPVEGWRDDATLPYRPALEEARTDDHGRAVLRGVSATADLLVGSRAEGYGEDRGYGSATRRVEPGLPVRIALARSRRVWWPITDAEGPIPPHGTVVKLHRGYIARSERQRSSGWEWGSLSAVTGRVERSVSEGARLVVDAAGGGPVWNGRRPSFDGQASSPDGRLAILHWDGSGERGPAISFRTPRTATIEILAGDGTPREGVEVAILGEGSPGNLHTRGYGFTDASGRAVIGGLYGGPARVVVRDPHRENLDEHASGRVDLEAGDAFLSIRLSERTPLEFVVHVRVNGEPRLPPTYSFTVWQGTESTTFWEGNIDSTMEDAATGTLRCTAWLLRPREKLGVSMNATGLYSGVMQEVPAGKREGPVEVSFDLHPPPPPPPVPPEARKDEGPSETPKARLLRLLDTGRVTFRGEGRSVSDALGFVAAAQGITIVVDSSAMDGAAVEADFSIVDRTVRDAIQEILGKADGLTFVVRGGVVAVVRR